MLKQYTEVEAEKISDQLSNHKHLMPLMGKSDTTHGEVFRAVNKIHYRSYNDGDTFWMGYGAETCGSAAAYLFNNHKEHFGDLLRTVFNKKISSDSKEYNDFCIQLEEITLELINKTQNSANTIDMLDSEVIWDYKCCDSCGEYKESTDMVDGYYGGELCSPCSRYEDQNQNQDEYEYEYEDE